jgi:exodeoxyribonuclease VII large subunit
MFMAASYPDDAEDAGLVAKEGAGDNAPPLSITELSALLKRTVEDRFGFVRVRGELSGVKRAASGHVYLCLKDEGARLDGVMWRGTAQRLAFAPEDGIEVIATGKLTTYPGRSNYQIVIERMEIAGEGALLALLAKTRERLAAEGLFDGSRKRPLPYLPRRIGVVTSPTGAVIRDILHRLADRFPSHVVVWPVLVQGQGAAEQVANAVRGFSALPEAERPDLVIVARGGGSIEDLWAFNEEVVVRHHPGRFRRRPARADADRGRRARRAGARGTVRAARRPRPAQAQVRPASGNARSGTLGGARAAPAPAGSAARGARAAAR